MTTLYRVLPLLFVLVSAVAPASAQDGEAPDTEEVLLPEMPETTPVMPGDVGEASTMEVRGEPAEAARLVDTFDIVRGSARR